MNNDDMKIYFFAVLRYIAGAFKFFRLKAIIAYLKGGVWYFKDLRVLIEQQLNNSTSDFKFGKFRPLINDKKTSGGTAKGHYFHQDLYVAQKIFANKPSYHVDIGSRVDGFVAHVASFMPIEVWDIRPIVSNAENIIFKKNDLMELSDYKDYCDSLSCLHALEHFGLGRYGDKININGHLVGLKNMRMMLKIGGKLYLSVPIGRQRVEFNAHRVFALSYLLEIFSENFTIDEFSYVDDNGDLHKNMPLNQDNVKSNFNCHYGCGIFELTKV